MSPDRAAVPVDHFLEPARAPNSRRLGGVAAATLLLTWGVDAARVSNDLDHPDPRFAIRAGPDKAGDGPLLVESGRHAIPIPRGKPTSHASSIVALTDRSGEASLLAFWFAGSRESGPDVEIVSSRFDLTAMEWSPPRISINRMALSRDLEFGVRRLGNPVAWVDALGRVHLFTVATGLGGWAASRVAHLVSDDEGVTFKPERVLPLSPWFNTSALVRAPAVPLADGGALLPMHFEFGNKYPIAMRITATGDPIAVVRMSHNDEALQPSIVPLDATRAVALLRDQGSTKAVKLLSTDDGGRSWVDEGVTNLDNPNAAVVGVRLPGGGLLAVLNPSRTGRHELAIALSNSGRDWRIVKTIESGEENDEFSYPSVVIHGGLLHLTFTDQRERISHRVYRLGALK